MAGLAGELLRSPSGGALEPTRSFLQGLTELPTRKPSQAHRRGELLGSQCSCQAPGEPRGRKAPGTRLFELGPLRQLAVTQRKTNDRRIRKMKTELVV